MRRMLLFLTIAFALTVAMLPAAGGAAPSENACNQGTMNAHAKIPAGVPGHHHVPSCHH